MVQIVLCLLFLPFFVDAARRSDLATIEKTELAIWGLLTIFVFAALALSTSMPEGVTLQYSGAAFLALTLGYPRALLSMTLLLLITQPLAFIGQSLLVDALLPVWLMLSLVGLTRRYLPPNLFVFLLGCGFIGLFIVYAFQVLGGAVLSALLWNGESMTAGIISEQAVWSLLLAGGEATLEGMMVTILVVFQPKMVALFDDDFYLSKPS